MIKHTIPIEIEFAQDKYGEIVYDEYEFTDEVNNQIHAWLESKHDVAFGKKGMAKLTGYQILLSEFMNQAANEPKYAYNDAD